MDYQCNQSLPVRAFLDFVNEKFRAGWVEA